MFLVWVLGPAMCSLDHVALSECSLSCSQVCHLLLDPVGEASGNPRACGLGRSSLTTHTGPPPQQPSQVVLVTLPLSCPCSLTLPGLSSGLRQVSLLGSPRSRQDTNPRRAGHPVHRWKARAWSQAWGWQDCLPSLLGPHLSHHWHCTHIRAHGLWARPCPSLQPQPPFSLANVPVLYPPPGLCPFSSSFPTRF